MRSQRNEGELTSQPSLTAIVVETCIAGIAKHKRCYRVSHSERQEGKKKNEMRKDRAEIFIGSMTVIGYLPITGCTTQKSDENQRFDFFARRSQRRSVFQSCQEQAREDSHANIRCVLNMQKETNNVTTKCFYLTTSVCSVLLLLIYLKPTQDACASLAASRAAACWARKRASARRSAAATAAGSGAGSTAAGCAAEPGPATSGGPATS